MIFVRKGDALCFLGGKYFLNVMSMSFGQERLGVGRNTVVGQKLVW